MLRLRGVSDHSQGSRVSFVTLGLSPFTAEAHCRFIEWVHSRREALKYIRRGLAGNASLSTMGRVRQDVTSFHSRDDGPDRFDGYHADKLLIEAIVEIAQMVRIEAQLVQDGRVKVSDMIAIDRRLHA